MKHAPSSGQAFTVADDTRRLVIQASSSTNTAAGTSYFDAADSGRDVDWQVTRTTILEDFHFNGSVRRIALARIRREAANNPYLKGLVEKYPEAIGCTSLRSRSRDPNYNLLKEAFWHRAAESIAWDGRSLRTVEDVVKIETLIAGELFLIKIAGGLVQLVASEFCGSPWGVTQFGTREVNGIVRDAAGRPIAYRFGKLDRWGNIIICGTDDELVPASQVIHVFDSKSVIMGRGIPLLLASVKTARDLYEITRSKTKQIKDVTSITGAIIKDGAENWLAQNGSTAGSVDSDGDDDTTSTAETVDSPADRVSTDGRPLKINLAPGTFVFLEPGEKLQQLVSSYEAADYKELIMLMLHAISTPVGLPVELWFSGLGDVNYSGFKGLGTQWKGRRAKICEFLVESFLKPLHDWRMRLAHDLGELPAAPASLHPAAPAASTIYLPTEDELIEWGWKRSAVLDDEKAAKANQTRLDSGESDLGEIWAENGLFSEEVFTRRRQVWIYLLQATGELEAGADTTKVIVPREFMLFGKLPGMLVVAGRSSPANNSGDNPADGTASDDAEDTADTSKKKAA